MKEEMKYRNEKDNDNFQTFHSTDHSINFFIDII